MKFAVKAGPTGRTRVTAWLVPLEPQVGFDGALARSIRPRQDSQAGLGGSRRARRGGLGGFSGPA